ncbi:hypothetical protein [Nocardioides sp.]|uniref:hypothetical protein n=1 Tax=Nocardioides sp. TaxID=35761 RepID=UPI003515F0DF
MTTPSTAGRALRAVVVGTVCGGGAMVAHGLAGGSAMPPTLLLVLPVSILIAAALLRRRPGPLPLAATALLAQLAWHCLWLSLGAGAPDVAGGEHAVHGGTAPAMLTAHLLVALLCTALGCGVERALLRVLARRVDDVLTRMVAIWAAHGPRVPARRVVPVAAAGGAGPRRLGRETRRDRAPPGPPLRLVVLTG